MRKILLYGIITSSITIISCTQENGLEPVRQVTQTSPAAYVIDISTIRNAGNILNRNSTHKSNFRYDPSDPILEKEGASETRLVESKESVVLPELQPHIWLGNIMRKSSIINCDYIPLIYPRNPITISLTLPGTVTGQIDIPSYSKFLSYLQEQTANGVYSQNGEFNFSTEQFTSYNELKVAFGSNVNTNGIFWGSSSSTSSTDHLISKATGLYIKFYQSSFKAIMDYPEGTIAQLPESEIDSAVYINSITYGRLGILTLETNESVFEAQDKITKIFKTIFYGSSSTFTKEEQTFLDGCEFKIYLIGGNGSTSVETFRGLDGFLQHIKKGVFSQNEPGAPIFCTFNHVKDNSPVSVNFKFSVKKEPLYVELVHKPTEIPKTIPSGRLGGTVSLMNCKIRGYGELYLKFYRNKSKIPTIAHPSIPISIITQERNTQNNRGNITTTETVDTLIMKNAGYQTSMLVVWTSYLGYVDSDGKRPMQTTSQANTYWFTPASGSGYRYSPSVESVKEYRLGESNDYIIVNTSSINQDNCPMSRRN